MESADIKPSRVSYSTGLIVVVVCTASACEIIIYDSSVMFWVTGHSRHHDCAGKGTTGSVCARLWFIWDKYFRLHRTFFERFTPHPPTPRREARMEGNKVIEKRCLAIVVPRNRKHYLWIIYYGNMLPSLDFLLRRRATVPFRMCRK